MNNKEFDKLCEKYKSYINLLQNKAEYQNTKELFKQECKNNNDLKFFEIIIKLI